jgi:geranylgeranyl pyrophosphate synthase
VSLSNYADVAGAKTGSLLRLGCRAGAILAGASDETIARYGDFGQNLGILAQAWNDLFGLAGLGGKRDIDHSRTLPILAALALDGPGHEPGSAEGQAGQLYALTQIHSLYRQAGETLARCPAQGHLGLFLDGYSLERWLGPEALQLRSSGEDDNAA